MKYWRFYFLYDQIPFTVKKQGSSAVAAIDFGSDEKTATSIDRVIVVNNWLFLSEHSVNPCTLKTQSGSY